MKFRVIDKLTGKEADAYEIALHEEWAKELCYCDMDGFAILEDGTLLLVDECGKFEYCDTDRFEIVFDDERPHGTWVSQIYETIDYYQCSVCKMLIRKDNILMALSWKYCPNCGASMVKKEGDEND
ncbi:MAG: hypothetical protein J6V44_08815 [Methanobrevibacter sp.]|nr:hypothetical protein [Methanobrevibacter sp.]